MGSQVLLGTQDSKDRKETREQQGVQEAKGRKENAESVKDRKEAEGHVGSLDHLDHQDIVMDVQYHRKNTNDPTFYLLPTYAFVYIKFVLSGFL